MSGKRAKQLRQAEKATTESSNRRFPRLITMLLPFAFGVMLTAGSFLIYSHAGESKGTTTKSSFNIADAGHRTVAQLMALSDAELEKVDLVEMSVAAAKEIPGYEKLDYQHYKQVVDGWSDDVRRWMPAAEVNFQKSPKEWRNDINFFRLGLLATYLTRERGIRYAEKYSQDQKEGKNSKYEDPGALLVHGLIDTLRGTCATMPVLHVAIGRRLGWPVSLASVGPHYVCRYDDGKVHYNIEATYAGPGFVSDSDEDYIKNDHLPRKAVTTGSDFRSLSAREMLGVFIGARARYYWDTKQYDAADRDYVLARVLYPNHRYGFRESIRATVWRGEQLFEPSETGHPATMAVWLASMYLRRTQGPTPMGRAPSEPPMVYGNPSIDVDQFNAMNRASLLPHAQGVPQPATPGVPRPPTYGPQVPPGVSQPGMPQPYQPYQPPVPGQPPR